jgi:cytochrome c-type biogenesis protein CcmF
VTNIGQLCLLAAFVASGYAAFACFVGWKCQHRLLHRAGIAAGVVGFLLLTLIGAILAQALLTRDLRFAYVAQYSSPLLPWHYALSAFWVGQAGSLLFWAWSVGVLAMIYRFWPRRMPSPLRDPAFAVLTAFQGFLVALMVFGADPMQPSLVIPREGGGLSPLLQHPAMLLHPPVVFFGYAGCTIPFALAIAALLTGRLDSAWLRDARRWAFFAWLVQGIGILVGAYWAYEELGWGGYWSWDPVENGSLIPWLTATAMIHAAMVYRQRGALKRTTIVMTAATFAACNFAAFLTRSGIFSSLHAFSQSPIGWMFLLLIAALALVVAVPLVQHRIALRPDNPLSGLSAKEGIATASVFALIFLAAAVFVGTASLPVSQVFFPHKVLFGAGFYNGVLIPISLLLMAAMAAAPLLRWGAPLETKQVKALLLAAGVGMAAAGLAWLNGLRHPLSIAVAGLAAMTASAAAASWVFDARQYGSTTPLRGFLLTLRNRQRTYASYVIHLGLACLAVGVAGSSLGTQQRQATLSKGESIVWAGRNICFAGVLQHRLPEKLVVQAELKVTADGDGPYTLLPAQEYYFLQNEWSSKVAIHSNWSGDFYTILYNGRGQDQIQLTLVNNPMMRWMWLAGWVMVVAAVPWFWTKKPQVETARREDRSPSSSRRLAASGPVAGKRRRTAA